jgi:Asp-tRNA(Asn)/Glu-tRNA(Gln) amidotransferase A subunit family amidase
VLPGAPTLRDDLAAVLDRAVAALGSEDEVELPDARQVTQLFSWVQLSEALEVHRPTWPSRREAYGADVAARLTLAEQTVVPADLEGRRHEVREAVLASFGDADVIALPVAACGPSTIADPDQVDGVPLRDLVLPFTTPASLCGLPAMSVPAGVDREGLPVGLQLLGRPDGEASLLAAAERLDA